MKVVYLARLREAFGRAEERLALAEADGVTVADVIAQLRARGGVWAAELAAGRAFRVAVNHTMASPDTTVHAGDEVALLPPVTGG
jgi:sulfur-carrier protein